MAAYEREQGHGHHLVRWNAGADEGLEHTVTRQDLDDLLQFVDHDYLEEHHDDAVPSLVAMYERLVAQLARGVRVKFAELKAAIAGDSHLVRAFLEVCCDEIVGGWRCRYDR